MPTVKNVIDMFIHECKAESARILNQSGLFMSFEVICNRSIWERCIEPKLDVWGEWELRGIERLNKDDENSGSVETGGGLYRYTLIIQK